MIKILECILKGMNYVKKYCRNSVLVLSVCQSSSSGSISPMLSISSLSLPDHLYEHLCCVNVQNRNSKHCIGHDEAQDCKSRPGYFV